MLDHKQFCAYDLDLPVTNFLTDMAKLQPLMDTFPTPNETGYWPHGEKRVWGIQYAQSEKILSKEYLAVIRNVLKINDSHNVLGAGIHGEDGGEGTVAWFRGEPNTHMHIHTDGGACWAINVVWGADNADMVWWQPKPGEQHHDRVSITGRSAPSWWESQCIELDRFPMATPRAKLVRTDIPHSAENHSSTVRWACSVRDHHKKWTWEEAVENLSAWIIPR